MYDYDVLGVKDSVVYRAYVSADNRLDRIAEAARECGDKDQTLREAHGLIDKINWTIAYFHKRGVGIGTVTLYGRQLRLIGYMYRGGERDIYIRNTRADDRYRTGDQPRWPSDSYL